MPLRIKYYLTVPYTKSKREEVTETSLFNESDSQKTMSHPPFNSEINSNYGQKNSLWKSRR